MPVEVTDVPYDELPDSELPGMWERADFIDDRQPLPSEMTCDRCGTVGTVGVVGDVCTTCRDLDPNCPLCGPCLALHAIEAYIDGYAVRDRRKS